jgi:hypothetical protein
METKDDKKRVRGGVDLGASSALSHPLSPPTLVPCHPSQRPRGATAAVTLLQGCL